MPIARTCINIFAIALLFALPLVAYAHVLRSDGDIGIVLHLDPQDEPLAGIPTSIYLAFKDTTGRFSFDACDCKLFVKPYAQKDAIDTSLSSDAFLHTHGDQLNVDATYFFQKPDVYALEVVGSPKDGSSFKAFTILFDVRVASYAQSRQSSSWTALFAGQALHFCIFGAGFLFFLGAVLYDRRKQSL